MCNYTYCVRVCDEMEMSTRRAEGDSTLDCRTQKQKRELKVILIIYLLQNKYMNTQRTRLWTADK